MLTKTTEPHLTTPTEVLIPEARQHRRQRHLRHGVAALICALVIATLIAMAVIVFGGPAAGGNAQAAHSARSATGSGVGQVSFRPVLCFADPYNPAQSTTIAPNPLCGSASALTQQHLDVTPNSLAQGYSNDNVAPDPALAGVPSTEPAAERASSTVLLPGLPVDGPPGSGERYVLGPTEMSSRSISSASAERDRTGQWIVDFRTTSSGAALWDRVAEQNFHLLLAIDLDGIVYSNPVIQPTQSSFSSFDGRGVISGGLTRADAVRLAGALNSDR